MKQFFEENINEQSKEAGERTMAMQPCFVFRIWAVVHIVRGHDECKKYAMDDLCGELSSHGTSFFSCKACEAWYDELQKNKEEILNNNEKFEWKRSDSKKKLNFEWR